MLPARRGPPHSSHAASSVSPTEKEAVASPDTGLSSSVKVLSSRPAALRSEREPWLLPGTSELKAPWAVCAPEVPAGVPARSAASVGLSSAGDVHVAIRPHGYAEGRGEAAAACRDEGAGAADLVEAGIGNGNRHRRHRAVFQHLDGRAAERRTPAGRGLSSGRRGQREAQRGERRPHDPYLQCGGGLPCNGKQRPRARRPSAGAMPGRWRVASRQSLTGRLEQVVPLLPQTRQPGRNARAVHENFHPLSGRPCAGE